jgi:hypothetical protein
MCMRCTCTTQETGGSWDSAGRPISDCLTRWLRASAMSSLPCLHRLQSGQHHHVRPGRCVRFHLGRERRGGRHLLLLTCCRHRRRRSIRLRYGNGQRSTESVRGRLSGRVDDVCGRPEISVLSMSTFLYRPSRTIRRIDPTSALFQLFAVAVTVSGCAGHSSTPTSPSAGVGVPTLTAPADQAYIPQNDSSTGCPNDPVWGYGLRIQFSWNRVPDAAGYRIHMAHPNAFAPFVDEVVPTAQHEVRRCTTAMGYLDNWKWKVRALGQGGIEGEWSQVRTVNFTDCQLGSRPCGSQP